MTQQVKELIMSIAAVLEKTQQGHHGKGAQAQYKGQMEARPSEDIAQKIIGETEDARIKKSLPPQAACLSAGQVEYVFAVSGQGSFVNAFNA